MTLRDYMYLFVNNKIKSSCLGISWLLMILLFNYFFFVSEVNADEVSEGIENSTKIQQEADEKAATEQAQIQKQKAAEEALRNNLTPGPQNNAPVGGSALAGQQAAESIGQDVNDTYSPDSGKVGRSRTALKLNLSTTQQFIYDLLTGLGSYALYFGGGLLEYAISALVVNMGGFIYEIGMGSAIDSLWEVMRDIFNLLFIFGLIYIGFVTILKADSSGTKKMLASIVAAALLINFSLYITKIIVDFTNLGAYQIYNAMTIDGGYQWGTWQVKGVAGKFIEMTDLQSYPPGAA
jgi:hypothetical protein